MNATLAPYLMVLKLYFIIIVIIYPCVLLRDTSVARCLLPAELSIPVTIRRLDATYTLPTVMNYQSGR